MTTIAQRITTLPRLARILLVAFSALSVTAVLFPLVDSLYLQAIYNPNTIMLPSLVSVGCGLLMYVLGWRWFVGTVGEELHTHQAAVWYLVIVIITLLILLALIFQGIAMTDAVAG